MEKYSIQTTSDYSYFPFLKVFINSILVNCDKNYLSNIYVINTLSLIPSQESWPIGSSG